MAKLSQSLICNWYEHHSNFYPRNLETTDLFYLVKYCQPGHHYFSNSGILGNLGQWLSARVLIIITTYYKALASFEAGMLLVVVNCQSWTLLELYWILSSMMFVHASCWPVADCTGCRPNHCIYEVEGRRLRREKLGKNWHRAWLKAWSLKQLSRAGWNPKSGVNLVQHKKYVSRLETCSKLQHKIIFRNLSVFNFQDSQSRQIIKLQNFV